MALTNEDFTLTETELAQINDFIRETVDAFYAQDPDADPLDQVSVHFEFAAGLGRLVTVWIAGKHMEIA